MEKKELFNKKTLKQLIIQKFMRGIFKKNCKYTTSGSQRTQLNNVGNLRVESGYPDLQRAYLSDSSYIDLDIDLDIDDTDNQGNHVTYVIK